MARSSANFPRRWRGVALIAFVITIAVYGLLWRAGASEMRRLVSEWVDDQRAAGLSIEHGDIGIGGFPFQLRANIDDVVIAAPGEWRWRTPRLAVIAKPTLFNGLSFEPAGEQSLFVAGFGHLSTNARRIRASISGDGDAGWAFDLSLMNASTVIGDNDYIEAADFLIRVWSDPASPTTVSAEVIADGLVTQLAGDELSLDAFSANLALTRLDALQSPAPGQYWRAAGGRFEIERFQLVKEAAAISATGALELDMDDFPAGIIETEIINPQVFVEELSADGLVGAAQKDQLIATLTLAAIAGGGTVATPIELKNGIATIAGVKIADLPKVY